MRDKVFKRKQSEGIYDTNTVRELEPVANDFINSIAYMQEPPGWYMLLRNVRELFPRDPRER